MGGWISVWLASQSKVRERIAGVILIAPALNFLYPQYLGVYQQLPKEIQQSLDNGKV